MLLNKLLSIKSLAYWLLSFVLLQLISCGGASSAENKTLSQERSLQTQWQARRFSVSGTVTDSSAIPLSDAAVSIDALSTRTDANGRFTLVNLQPANKILHITHADYRDEILAVNVQRSLTSSASITLKPIALIRKQASQVRFLFGGDAAFARRFLDPSETTPLDQVPPDNPAALIQASNPAAGTADVMRGIKPWYQEADWSLLNLETPVTNNPLTPHQEKDFAFFTLPGSLDALKDMGVDYVSQGNNHVFDYLEAGLRDSLLNLDKVGIKHSGAGVTPAAAFAAHRETIKGQQYAFISATSVSGDQYSTNYVAAENKGGAADLRQDADVINTIQTELAAGFVPIVQWHTGKEYTFTPTSYAAGRMALAADNGAALVVSHHPHVAQGVSRKNGVVILESLGNLAFDQSRLETFLGLMARVDMTAASVDQLRLLPVYLKHFAPLPITGDLANRFIRRIGEYSNGRGLMVYPYQNQGMVALNAADVVVTEQLVDAAIIIPASGVAIVDLREYADSAASLSMLETTENVSMKIGRDIMLYGDFEDWDVDDKTLEAAHWNLPSASRFVCLSHAYRGVAGLCSIRDESNQTDSVSSFRNRIRVMGDALNTPNKMLSLFGYIQGDNAGEVNIIARYYASTGAQTFGEEVIFNHLAGSYDWTPFNVDLSMPADDAARASRIFIHHAPPANGKATVAFDELALINWEEDIVSGDNIVTPHARDFIRLQGEAGSAVNLTLHFSHYAPVY